MTTIRIVPLICAGFSLLAVLSGMQAILLLFASRRACGVVPRIKVNQCRAGRSTCLARLRVVQPRNICSMHNIPSNVRSTTARLDYYRFPLLTPFCLALSRRLFPLLLLLLLLGRRRRGCLPGAAAPRGARADAVAVLRAPALGRLALDRVVATEDDVDGVLDAHALVRVHRDAVAERKVRVRLEAHRSCGGRRFGPGGGSVGLVRDRRDPGTYRDVNVQGFFDTPARPDSLQDIGFVVITRLCSKAVA
jgi:hypothetical protein